jgi:hypothetical protein
MGVELVSHSGGRRENKDISKQRRRIFGPMKDEVIG